LAGSATDAPWLAALERLEQGIAVFDGDLALCAWNARFAELDERAGRLLQPGRPLADFLDRHRPSRDGGNPPAVAGQLAALARGDTVAQEVETGGGAMLRLRYAPFGHGGVLHSCSDATDAQRAVERALQRREQRYAQALEAINEGVYDWDIAGGTVIYAERVLAILGIPASRLRTPGDWLGRVHPDDLAGYKQALAAHFKGVTPRFEHDYRYRADDGSWRWARQHGLALRDAGGRAIRMVGSTGDITELKAHERDLAAATAEMEATLTRFGAVLEAIDYGVVFYDDQMRALLANRAFCELWQIPRAFFSHRPTIREMIEYNRGKGVYAVPDTEWEAFVDRRVEEIRHGELSVRELHRADGKVLINDCIALRGGGRMLTYFDITRQKRIEQALRASEELYALATRAALEGIYDWNLVTDSLYVSDRAREMYQFGDGAMTAASWNARIHPDDFAGYRQALIDHFRQRNDHLEHEYRIRTEQGAYSWVLDRAIGVRDPTGRVVRLVGAVSDITPRKQAELRLQQQNEILQAEIAAHQRSRETIEYLASEIRAAHDFGEIVGQSPRLTEQLAQLDRVAGTDTTVLVLGETGTGKELVVRAIHARSARANRPLVKVNCAALPAGLVESELFGHEKGAFTGATDTHKGRFELADGGTLYLDEVGELPLETQAKLLRALHEHEFQRVGGNTLLRSDVRLIAATNRDLAGEVAAGRFRSDLFYRLNVFPVTLPPLRERAGDIELLASHFLERAARRIGRRFSGISAAFLAAARDYAWPGNIRELENVIERAAILSPGPELELPAPLGGTAVEPSAPGTAARPLSGTLAEVERAYICEVLERCGGVIEGARGAAAELGLNPSTLRGRMRKLGIRMSRQTR
jgi:PAS domain S-box-containing protein